MIRTMSSAHHVLNDLKLDIKQIKCQSIARISTMTLKYPVVALKRLSRHIEVAFYHLFILSQNNTALVSKKLNNEKSGISV